MSGIEVVDVSLPDGGRVMVRAERVGETSRAPADVGLREFMSFSHVRAIKSSRVLALVADAGALASVRMRLERHADAKTALTPEPGDPPSDVVARTS